MQVINVAAPAHQLREQRHQCLSAGLPAEAILSLDQQQCRRFDLAGLQCFHQRTERTAGEVRPGVARQAPVSGAATGEGDPMGRGERLKRSDLALL
jgi:hypothetical protein